MAPMLRPTVAAAVAVLAAAAGGVRGEVACFDVAGCSDYYVWLGVNVIAESLTPSEKGIPLPDTPNLTLSENNLGSFAKCQHAKIYGHQDVQYCVYTMKPSTDSVGQLFTETLCESESEFGHCLPNGVDFKISEMLVFNTSDGRKEYLDRCPPADRAKAEEKLEYVGDAISNMTENGNGLVNLAVERQCGLHTQPINTGPIVMISITVFLMFLGATSSLLEYLAQLRALEADDRSITGGGEDVPLLTKSDVSGFASVLNQKTPLRYFNLHANLGELFSSSGARSLGGLDGLKGFSMLWIILAHASLFATFLGTGDPAAGKNFVQQTNSYFAYSATFGVDTFFFVSGQLTAYVLSSKLRKMKKQPGVGKFLLFMALRWLRLTPLFAYVLFMYTYVASVAADGPFWYKMVDETSHCKYYWWSNLLYVNNFVPSEYHNQCMAWSWYLANDLQFYVVALIVMFLYLRSPRAGAALAALLTTLSVIIGYVLAVQYDLGANSGTYQNAYYDKPYTRMAPYTLGLLLGMALRDTNLKRIRLSTPVAFLAQFFCVSMIVFLFYIQAQRYNLNFGYDNPMTNLKSDWTKYDYAAYNSFGRLAYVLALGGMCVLNASGNGGIVYAFLSLPFWEPMGKLTFGAYLIHPVLLRIYYYSEVELIYFNHINQTVIFVAAAALGYGLSMVTYVLIELPCDSGIKSMLGLNKRR